MQLPRKLLLALFLLPLMSIALRGADLQLSEEFLFNHEASLSLEFNDPGCGAGYVRIFLSNQSDATSGQLFYMNDCGWGSWTSGKANAP